MDGGRHPIWLRRFLYQGTTWQKLLLAFGAVAGALLAIGALAVSLNRLVDGDNGPTRSEPATTSSSAGAPTFRRADPLKSETADVDELVALLTLAADAYAAERTRWAATAPDATRGVAAQPKGGRRHRPRSECIV